MSRLFATAGTKLFIGDAMAFDGDDLVASDFTGASWTEVKGTTNLGAAGDTSELITSNQIGSARTRKLKGTRNAGSMTVVCDLDYGDPGQLALVAAEKAKETYAFKLEFNDAPEGGTPSQRLFVALVMSASEELNEANSVMSLNATLEIDSNIVRVAAAEDES
jgi:Phage tail protein.